MKEYAVLKMFSTNSLRAWFLDVDSITEFSGLTGIRFDVDRKADGFPYIEITFRFKMINVVFTPIAILYEISYDLGCRIDLWNHAPRAVHNFSGNEQAGDTAGILNEVKCRNQRLLLSDL